MEPRLYPAGISVTGLDPEATDAVWPCPRGLLHPAAPELCGCYSLEPGNSVGELLHCLRGVDAVFLCCEGMAFYTIDPH